MSHGEDTPIGTITPPAGGRTRSALRHLTAFGDESPEPKLSAPASERILSGAPRTRIWNHVSSLAGAASAGVWEATPGAWRVTYRRWEFCHILSGRGRLEDADGRVREIAPGDAFVLEPGFDGVWTVAETMTKHYVILDPHHLASSKA